MTQTEKRGPFHDPLESLERLLAYFDHQKSYCALTKRFIGYTGEHSKSPSLAVPMKPELL